MVEPLGDPQAVRVVEETGLLTKGQQAAGVARPERGTAGRVAHCPMGVFVTSASLQGHVRRDRALSLPTAWTNDAARCQGAGMPAARALATKPPLAQQRLQRALAAGMPAAWVTGERVEGEQRSRRLWLEAHVHAPLWAVAGQAEVWRAGRQPQVKALVAPLGAAGWGRWSAGDGAQGPRWAAGRWLPLAPPLQPPWRRWLLVRRRRSDATA